MNWNLKDTIAALATPMGLSGVAIVRLSGPRSFAIASALSGNHLVDSLQLDDQLPSHRAKLQRLFDSEGQWLDDVVILPMRGPRSFTGEDVIELQCHGSMLIVRKILESCFFYGARSAEPGEFSLRAYRNQKIDLAQAEAVQQLIHAKSERALKAAQSHLEGRLSKKIASFQKRLIHQAAILEAWVDFPEEGLEFATFDQVLEAIDQVQVEMMLLLNSYHQGQLIREGVRLCLLGRPNVGKSSLMNALLRKERSIVTDIPGTTRDVIEEEATLCGLHVRLIDTAGVRHAQEKIEEEGIRRTWLKVEEADLVLWVLDASVGYSEEEMELSKRVPKAKTILIWNKCDLLPSAQTGDQKPLLDQLADFSLLPKAHISAKELNGIELLESMIANTLFDRNQQGGEELLLTSLRHQQALQGAHNALNQVKSALMNRLSAEFVCSDMRQALRLLAQIIGSDVSEEILTAIFSTFCLGK